LLISLKSVTVFPHQVDIDLPAHGSIGMNTMKYSHNTNDQREADGLERINFYLMKTWYAP
jgi:hypothetical protein